MSNPLRTPEDYELFLYTLTERFPSVRYSTPHHKHIPPDPKHNRIPAPGMSFTQPNLPALIQEIEVLIQTAESKAESKKG